MLGLYVIYNWRTTGDALENGYQASGDLSQSVGFSGVHSVAAGLDNTFYNVATLDHRFEWLAGLCRPGVRPRAVRPGDTPKLDWFFLACALAIISSAAFYYTTGAVKGPRYVYEAVPFLLLLAARGFDVLAALGERALHHPHQEIRDAASRASSCTPRHALIATSLTGWMFADTHMEGRRRSCECKRTLRSTLR